MGRMGLARSPRRAKLTANMTPTVTKTKFIRFLMVTQNDETRPVAVDYFTELTDLNHHVVSDKIRWFIYSRCYNMETLAGGYYNRQNTFIQHTA